MSLGRCRRLGSRFVLRSSYPETRGHRDRSVSRGPVHSAGVPSSRGWSFESVRNGQLFPWQAGQRLVLPVHEIWCRVANGPLRRLEVLLNEREANAFVFRRDSRVVASIDRTFIQSNSGIPVLAPEIVLLYKSKRAVEPKEQLDFSNMLNALDTERRQWLLEEHHAD